MAYTRTVYGTYDFNTGVRSPDTTVTEGEGVTLHVGGKTYQVMSDIWEYGYYAIIWDEANQKVTTVDWVGPDSKADATPEVIEKAKAWMREQKFTREYNRMVSEARGYACELKKGAKAIVVRGRKYPKGLVGTIIGFTENQWGRKVGIAISDVKVEVIKPDGRKFMNHRDVAWVARHNVERHDPDVVDTQALADKANIIADRYVANAGLFAQHNQY